MEACAVGSMEQERVLAAAESARTFESFFASSYADVYRAVVLVTRDQAAAEDALGDAYTKALEQWSSLQGHPRPTAWLIRVAINNAVSSWRRLRRLVPLSEMRDPLLEPALAEPDLMRALDALPLRQRQVVALRILMGFDTDETGQVLGIASGTVTAHLSRALTSLRKKLTEDD